jgi:choice-of-anchor B domain-containing protein
MKKSILILLIILPFLLLSQNSQQEITLESGWSLFSTYIITEDNSVESVFSNIINDVIIIKDENGNVYWPEFGLNSIGNLNIGDAYQIKMNNTNTLTLTGTEANCSTNISLNTGWNFIGYLNPNSYNVEDTFSPILEELIIIKDSNGNVYWPLYSINTIGTLYPGEGYQIKVSSDLEFNYTCESTDGSFNMELISIHDYNETINDVWGYAINNNEYALVGTNEGFSVVNISSPESPEEIFFIEGTSTIWRDIKTWQNYAYIVCDQCPDGLLIVDLNDLSGSTYSFNTEFFNKAHNIFIDENGYLYAFGGDLNGVMILNLNNDPMNPAFESVFSDYYLHDGMVQNDTLWGGAIYEGMFIAIDVTDKSNPILMSSHPTSSNFTHNCWVSIDGNTLFTTDEVSGAYIGAYDVSNIYDIQQLDLIQEWTGLGDVIPHNTHVIGNYLVTSYYTSGITIIDASDPYNLIEVAYFDTSPQYEGNGFYGCWGAYPYLPSGLILATDRQNGLHILNTNLELISN